MLLLSNIIVVINTHIYESVIILYWNYVTLTASN